MEYDDSLLDLDYLVFSSHKTATQSVADTLRINQFRCVHCHTLIDIGLRDGGFKSFLDGHRHKHKTKLVIINTFREPIERRISSFFQWHADGVVRVREVKDLTETIIYKFSIQELQERLIDEMDHEATELAKQADESTAHICRELDISVDSLTYNPQIRYGVHETDRCKIFLFRFDILTKMLSGLLSTITETPIAEHRSNISADKWYADIYTEFIESLRLDHNAIKHVYECKRDLINLFYPNEYGSLLTTTLKKYG